jgi:hypothetical protein
LRPPLGVEGFFNDGLSIWNIWLKGLGCGELFIYLSIAMEWIASYLIDAFCIYFKGSYEQLRHFFCTFHFLKVFGKYVDIQYII